MSLHVVDTWTLAFNVILVLIIVPIGLPDVQEVLPDGLVGKKRIPIGLRRWTY